jgi:EmrB/QacA subfamily drug resistance transporter
MNERLSAGPLLLAAAGAMLALLLASLDQTIVGTAMPRIVADLRGLDYYAWVTTAYLVSSTVVLPVAGKLGDLFGRKPFLIAGVAGFVAASALCGLSRDMTMLIAFRSVQGLFAGLLIASVFAVLADIFPPERRARMQGVFGAAIGISSLVGPTLGGYLTDGPGWRWVFYVNLPIGAAALAAIAVALPFVRSRAGLRDIDWLGSAVLTACLVPLLVGLSITGDHAWTSPEVLALLAGAAVMLVAFLVVELQVAQPIVPLRLLRNGPFTVSILVAFFAALGLFGVILFVPLLYQGVLGVSATNSGQLLTPMMLSLLVSSTLAGQLITRVRYYRFVGTAGVALMIAGLVLLAQVGIQTSQWDVARDIVLVGLGLGLVLPLTVIVPQAAVPRELLGVVTSQATFWRNLGGAVGTAMLGTLLARRLPDAIQGQVSGLHLPPGFRPPAALSTTSPQALFDPANLAHVKAAAGPQAAPLVDQLVHATRVALASTLHDAFLVAAAVLALALVATLLLHEVPLQGQAEPAAGEEAAPERAIA